MVLNLIFPILPPRKVHVSGDASCGSETLLTHGLWGKTPYEGTFGFAGCPADNTVFNRTSLDLLEITWRSKINRKDIFKALKPNWIPQIPVWFLNFNDPVIFFNPLIFTGNPLELHVDRSSVWLENVAKARVWPELPRSLGRPLRLHLHHAWWIHEGCRNLANSQFTAVETEDIIYKRYKFGRGWWWLWLMLMWLMWLMWLMIVGWLCCVAININLCLTDFFNHPPWLSQANNWNVCSRLRRNCDLRLFLWPNCTLINEPAGRWVETHGCRAAGRGKGCITTLWPVVKWDEIGSNGPSNFHVDPSLDDDMGKADPIPCHVHIQLSETDKVLINIHIIPYQHMANPFADIGLHISCS